MTNEMSCNHTYSAVFESRIVNFMRFTGKAQVKVIAKYRRRICKSCGYRWSTYELESEFLDQFCRPAGRDENSAISELKILKHKLASLSQ